MDGKYHKFLACVETTAPTGNTFWRIFYDDGGDGGDDDDCEMMMTMIMIVKFL